MPETPSSHLVEICNEYGKSMPTEYGGLFVEDQGHLVVLFTENVEEHRAALIAALPPNQVFEVRHASRTLVEVEEDVRYAQDVLFSRQDFGVRVVGMGRDERSMVVHVRIDPFTESAVQGIANLLSPRPVTVRPANGVWP